MLDGVKGGMFLKVTFEPSAAIMVKKKGREYSEKRSEKDV
jgi:hypothetical protein